MVPTTTAFPLWFAHDESEIGSQPSSSSSPCVMADDPFVPRIDCSKATRSGAGALGMIECYDAVITPILKEFIQHNFSSVTDSKPRYNGRRSMDTLNGILNGVRRRKRPLGIYTEDDDDALSPYGGNNNHNPLIPSCVEDTILLHRQDASKHDGPDVGIMNHHDILVDWGSLVAAPVVSTHSTTARSSSFSSHSSLDADDEPLVMVEPSASPADTLIQEVDDNRISMVEGDIEGDWTLLEGGNLPLVVEASPPFIHVERSHAGEDDFVLL